MVPPGDFRLSRWTGEFLDRQLERSFQAEAWPRHCLALRGIALIAGFLYAVMLYPTWQGFGPGSAFRILLALRLGTAVCLWAIAYVSRPMWPQRRVQLLVLLTILFMVATRLAENGLAPQRLPAGPGPGGFVFPVMPLIIFAVVAIPLRLALVWSAVGALLVLRDQVIRLGFHAALAQLTLANFLVAVGVGYAFRVSWNRITRRDFALRQALGREVAERQAAELEARRANAAKSRFLAVMSHEIRTPLNGVLGGLQILAGGPLLPEQRQPLDLAAHSGEQLALLLDEILDLARIEADHLELAREAFRPDALLEGVHAVLYPQAQAKGLTLRVERPAQLPPALEGDLLRLRQVLINLAGNGVKFTERGEVVLTLQVDPLDPAAERVRCTFTVRDTGPGLKPEDQERIWAPFAQGDGSIRRRHGGAGLGLAISRELVAAMGGELSLESHPGQGCRFRFAVELPTVPAPAAPAPQAPAQRPLRILVVDDLEANRIVAEGLLAGLGHRTLAAASGAQALALLQTEPLDAVLLDLHMPDMDGQELLRRLRALPDPGRAGIPVFLASADLERTRIQACLDAGMQGAIAKPLRKEKLAALFAGIPGAEPASRPVPAELPLVDDRIVAGLKADLGSQILVEGLCACRATVEACMAELAEPELAGAALHRLAGLAATYALPRLLLAVRQAELQVAEGGARSGEDLGALARRSLAALEAVL